MAGLREMSLRPFVRVPLLFLCALPPSRPLSTRREELTTDRGRPLYDNRRRTRITWRKNGQDVGLVESGWTHQTSKVHICDAVAGK